MSGEVTIFTNNILEAGSVTVTGSPDSGFPEERLWDRNISLFWLTSGTQATVIQVDQGATGNVAVDFLSIESHNFDGETIAWQYSPTGAFAGEETDAVAPWVQSGNGQIIVELGAPVTARYWRVTITSMSGPTASEVFMGLGNTFNLMFSPSAKIGHEVNVSWRATVGGPERSTRFGVKRKTRSYGLFLDNDTDLATLRTALDYLDDFSKPLYLKDHEGNYWLCRFAPHPSESWDNPDASRLVLNLLEML